MTYKKKLIEVALPLEAINRESVKQKTMGAAPHPQNIHRWWARRPLAAARAVLFAQLVDDPSSNPDLFPTADDQQKERRRLFDLIEQLIPWGASFDEKILGAAQAEISRSCHGNMPQIIDPFGGGGAIPLEAVRLGLPAITGDLNPVAVLLQRAMLEIPQRFASNPPSDAESRSQKAVWTDLEGIAADVRAYGEWLEAEAKGQIGDYFPKARTSSGQEATPIAWIWARTVKSPDPSWPGQVPLVRSWELVRRKGSPAIWIEPTLDDKAKTISYSIRVGGAPINGTVGRNGGVCLATGTTISFDYIREQALAGLMSEVQIAIVAESPEGRVYLSPGDTPAIPAISSEIASETISHWPGRTNVVGYGLTHWRDLFTSRQILALSTFTNLLDRVHHKVLTESHHLPDDTSPLSEGGRGRVAYADAIVTYLALVISKCSDFQSSICSWNASTSQVRNTFARQAIPMTWDFAEANPFSGKMASWRSMLEGVARAIGTLPASGRCEVHQLDASANLIRHSPAILCTDPPYYDNISYADLSDFFYVWLRRSLRKIWPNECSTVLTPKIEELIANPYRAGSKTEARDHFENGMAKVFASAATSADSSFPATIFYAFKATESDDSGIASTGWETFLSGLLNSGWAITATWPIRTEMQAKIGVNAGDNMLASSIVLACRKRSTIAPLATRSDFVAELRKGMHLSVSILQQQNIAPVDLAQSAIGPGIAIFSRYSRVVEANGSDMTVRSALLLINEVLSEILSGEEAEFDADTRFALTWYEQFGFSDGQFGDADVLAKAKNTTVDNVVRAGVAQSRGGKVRLISRNDLPSDWNPVEDKYLTVWEVAHHLIRALEDSEAKAAALLKVVGGGLGDRARQLSYLLFQVSDRKKRADDAAAYNMLVTAWPQLLKLVSDSSGTTRDGLF